MFRTLNLLQNLLLNNPVTQEHARGLQLYSQAVLNLFSSDTNLPSAEKYKHLFEDLIYQLKLPVQGSDHEGVNEACLICVQLLADVFI